MRKLILLVILGCYFFSSLIPFALAQNTGIIPKRPQQAFQRGDMVRSFGSVNSAGSSASSVGQINGMSPEMGMGQMNANMMGIQYQVHVLGEVKNPGIYHLPASSRLTDALEMAGGGLPNGSSRNIQLKRESKSITIDSYAYIRFGDLNNNPYLMDNDVIFIPVKKGEVEIEGPVSRPGNYEIKGPTSLGAIVKSAGGFVVGRAIVQPIRVVRFDETGKKSILEVHNDEESISKFTVKKGDVIVVPHVLTVNKKFDYDLSRIPGDNIFYPTINDNVYVIGAVSQPGSYPFQPSFNYQNYIGLAGPTNLSSLRRIKVIRSDGKKVAINKVKEINPGDTIVVPPKAVTVTNTLTWFNTIVSTTLTTILLYDNINNR